MRVNPGCSREKPLWARGGNQRDWECGAADFFGVISSRRGSCGAAAEDDGRDAGPPRRAVAVAEAGTAHGGDLTRGLELIDAAAEAGADVVKFQVVFADEILPPQAGLVPLPGGPVPLYEVFRSLERAPEFYAALAAHADSRGIDFLATPFGERSVRLLEGLGVRAWKAASPELNHEPLLGRLARTGRPIILSTGVSRPEDIQRALEVIDSEWREPAAASRNQPVSQPSAEAGNRAAAAERNQPVSQTSAQAGNRAAVIILHCLTCYPAPENEANLRAIPAMAAAYGRPVGLSDHSLHPVLLPALAAALGAVVVEKHITLDRGGGGLDDKVALVPDDFAKMISAMRHFGAMPFADALEELKREFTAERVESCLGSGRIGLAPSEEASYGRSGRSLHAVGCLGAGTMIGPENTALLRTEKVLKPGLAPRERHSAYGRRLRHGIPPGEGITWDDLD